MRFEPRAVVTESLDSKQSNMAFDWLLALAKDSSPSIELPENAPTSTLEHWVSEDLGLEQGAIAWMVDPKTKNESLVVGLGDNMQVCYSKRHFHRQTQIMFAAPTALDTIRQVEYWSHELIELCMFYQDTLEPKAA